MLLEFSCSNYMSIKDRVTFSFIAGKDTEHEDELIQFEKWRVLKTAVIYGANGSGKTNFLSAMNFMKKLVIYSINNQPGDEIIQHSHKLLGDDEASTYDIQIVLKGIRYSFGFTLRNNLIEEEYLYYFPKGTRKSKIYERRQNEYKLTGKFRNRFDACKDVLKSNRLLLSCAANFSSVEEILNVFSFFKKDLIFYGEFTDAWMQGSLKKMHEDVNVKNKVVHFLNQLGSDVKDIKIKIKEKDISIKEMFPFVTGRFANEKDTIISIEAKIVYDQFEVNLKTEESSGVNKLVEMLYPIMVILEKGKILVCDEFEESFHEMIVCKFVELFQKSKLNKGAQLLFSTHDTSILNLDMFRRDQIWFTELKKEDRATDLYSLIEIKNVRKDENIEKGYITGKYGAIPALNAMFAKITE